MESVKYRARFAMNLQAVRRPVAVRTIGKIIQSIDVTESTVSGCREVAKGGVKVLARDVTKVRPCALFRLFDSILPLCTCSSGVGREIRVLHLLLLVHWCATASYGVEQACLQLSEVRVCV